MRKIYIVTWVIALLLQTLQAEDKITKIELLGDNSYPPYSYLEKDEAKGVYVDVIQAAFEKIPDYSVSFKMYAWKRDQKMVKVGKAIGFFPPYFSEDRTKWTEFSEPILEETVVVFAKDPKILAKKKWPEDFYGLSVCMNAGFGLNSMGGEAFKTAIESKKIKLHNGKTNDVCLKQIEKGRSDFYINDRLIDTSAFPNIQRGAMVKVNNGYIGFTLKKKNFPHIDDVRKKFNAVILKMQQSGEIDQIIAKYIK
jgi:polar amino acid transport system substrate-binding protein